MKKPSSHVIGVDVGGTFTDVFIFDQANGRVAVAKVPSTGGRNSSDDQSDGFITGIRERVNDFSEIATIVHGTTVGTNALLERKVAKAGVINTTGFRDVLEMRRRDRPSTWGLWGQFTPIVARDFRLEVTERTLADGSVRTKVDIAGVKRAARQLLRQGAEALAIFFINSYANDRNEKAALAAVRTIWPNAHVSASSEILPEIREFERASTTAINAALQPVIGRYLERLESSLRAQGFAGQLLIVQSNGGVMSVRTATRLPVRTTLSGPAAGVIACAHIAGSAGFPNVITGDMGGTSFDVSLIAKGESRLSPQTAIDFGLVVRTPMIEITTIGAGGGSIAWVDRSGLLHIGPESAGADPGPVCYGAGGGRPTVTDANVVLGRINAERPIGGKLARLDVDAARKAIKKSIGDPLGLGAMEAAEAIIRVANAKMAGAVRLVSIERGHDPKQFAYMPFGGGGALHVCAMMREVGAEKGLVPRYPGVTSAVGCVIADMRHDFVQTLNTPLEALDIGKLRQRLRSRWREGEKILSAAGVVFERIERTLELDMLYVGQTHTLSVPVVTSDTAGVSRESIRLAFDTSYRDAYGRLLDGIGIRVLNMRVAVTGRRRKFDLALLAAGMASSLAAASAGSRRLWLAGSWHEAPVYQRLQLPIGSRIAGPALFEQPDTTIYLEPGMTAEVDRLGNIIISRA